MFDVHQLKAEDLQGLDAETATQIAALMLERIGALSAEIKHKDAKLQKVTFELARLKALKYGARTEVMTAEQRRLFEETIAEDEASLQAQLDALRDTQTQPTAVEPTNKRLPRRQPLPDHLRRVEHRHEPEDTNCPTPACGQPMVRIGEDVS